MGTVTYTPLSNMHFLILSCLAAAATQIVPYEHVEVPAEPYVHVEVPAEPYIHEEPEISPLALGVVRPAKTNAAPQQIAAPVIAPQQFTAPQQFIPQQFAAPQQFAGPVWSGYCINNLGEGVPCRKQF